MTMYLNKAKYEHDQLASVGKPPHMKSSIFNENQMITMTRAHKYDSQSNINFPLCDEKPFLVVRQMGDSTIHAQQSLINKNSTEMHQTPTSQRPISGHFNNSTPRHEALFMHNHPWNHRFSSTPVIKLPEQGGGNYLNTNTAHLHLFNSTPAHQNNRLLHHSGMEAGKYLDSIIFNNPTDLSFSSRTTESSSSESYQEEPINYSLHSRHRESSATSEPKRKLDTLKWADGQLGSNHPATVEGGGKDQKLMCHTDDNPSSGNASYNDVAHVKSKCQPGNVCNYDDGVATKGDFHRSQYSMDVTFPNTDKASNVTLGLEKDSLKTDKKTYAQVQGKEIQPNVLGHLKNGSGAMNQTMAFSNGGVHINKNPKLAGHFVHNVEGPVKQISAKNDKDRRHMPVPAKDPSDVLTQIHAEPKSFGHLEVKSDTSHAILTTSEVRAKEFSHNFPALFSLLDISQDSAGESSHSSCAASDLGRWSANVGTTHGNSAGFGFNGQPFAVNGYRTPGPQKQWDFGNSGYNVDPLSQQVNVTKDVTRPYVLGVPKTFYTPQASRSVSGDYACHPSAFATPQPQRFTTRGTIAHGDHMSLPSHPSQKPGHIPIFSETATHYGSKNVMTSTNRPVHQTAPPLSSTVQKIISSNLITGPTHILSRNSLTTGSASLGPESHNFKAPLLDKDTSSSKFAVENKSQSSGMNSTGFQPHGAPLHENNYGSHTLKHTCHVHQPAQVKAHNKFHRCKECAYEEVQEEIRRANDQTDKEINNDQVLTFHTENTPSQSSGSSSNKSLLGSIGSDVAVEAREDYVDEAEFMESFQDSNNLTVIDVNKTLTWGDVDKTPVSGETRLFSSATVNSSQGRTAPLLVSGNKGDSLANSDSTSANQTSEALHFHNDQNEGSLDQTKSYNEEGTPLCFSRVSSLSSLHSSEARDHDGGPRPVVNVLGTNLTNIDEVETKEANLEYFTDKTLMADNFGNPNIPESPLMFSRGSSPQSLSSFDMQSIHSNVVSEHSLRASDVTSPEALDSPLGSTTSKKMDSPSQRSGHATDHVVTSNDFHGDQGQGLQSYTSSSLEQTNAATCGDFQTPTAISSKSKMPVTLYEKVEQFSYAPDNLLRNLPSINTKASETKGKLYIREDMPPVFTKFNVREEADQVETDLPSGSNIKSNSTTENVSWGTAVAPQNVKAGNPDIILNARNAPWDCTNMSQTAAIPNAKDPRAFPVSAVPDLIKADSAKMTPHANGVSSDNVYSLLSSFISHDDIDSTEDCFKRYATEDTPSLYSSPSGISLAPKSPQKSTVLSPENDAKSDSSSQWKESEELLLQQVIQSGMPKSKTGRRLPGKEFVKAGIIQAQKGSNMSSTLKTLKNQSVTVRRQKVPSEVGNGNTSWSLACQAGDARSKEAVEQTPNRLFANCASDLVQDLSGQFTSSTLPKSRIPRRCLREEFVISQPDGRGGADCLNGLTNVDEKIKHGNDVGGVSKYLPSSREENSAWARSDEEQISNINIRDAEEDRSCEDKNNEKKISLKEINNATADACPVSEGKTVDIAHENEAPDLIKNGNLNVDDVSRADTVNEKDVRTYTNSKQSMVLGQESQVNHSSCKRIQSTQAENQGRTREKLLLPPEKRTGVKPRFQISRDSSGSTQLRPNSERPMSKENKSKTFKGFSYNNESSLLMSFRDCPDVHSAVFNENNIVELADDTDDDVDSYTVQQAKSNNDAGEVGVDVMSWRSAESLIYKGNKQGKAKVSWNGATEILNADNEEQDHNANDVIDKEVLERGGNLEDDANEDFYDFSNGMSPQCEENIPVGINESMDEEWMTESSMTSSSLSLCSFGDCPEFTPCKRGQVASFFEINKTVVPESNHKQDKKNKPQGEKGKSRLKVAQSLKRLFGSVRPGKRKEGHLKSLAKGKVRSPNVDLSKGGNEKSKFKTKRK